MNSIDIDTWNRFENRVLNLLQYPEEYLKQLGKDFQPFVCVLRLWKYPTFAEYSSYLVFKPAGHLAKSEFLLVTVIWNRPEELRNFSDPTNGLKYRLSSSVDPLITFHHTWLEPDVVLNSLQSLQCLNCQPFPDCSSINLDGIITGIEVQSSSQQTSFSWINNGPSQWGELIDLVENLYHKFNGS